MQLDLPGFELPVGPAPDRYTVRPLVTRLHQLGLPNPIIRELCAIVLLWLWATNAKPQRNPEKPPPHRNLLQTLATHLSAENIRTATSQALHTSFSRLATAFAANSQVSNRSDAEYFSAFAEILSRANTIPPTNLTPLIGWLASPDQPHTGDALLACLEETLQATDYQWNFASPEWLLTLLTNLSDADSPIPDPEPTADPTQFTTLPGPQAIAALLGANADPQLFLGSSSHRHDVMIGITRFVLQQPRPAIASASFNEPPSTPATRGDGGPPFDFVLTNPPFSTKEGNPEELFITRTLESLAPNRRAAIIVPSGFLYRGGSARNLRRRLIEEGYVEAVISLPSRIFTGAPNVNTAILLLQAGNQGPNNLDPGKKTKAPQKQQVLLIDGASLLGGTITPETTAQVLSLLQTSRRADGMSASTTDTLEAGESTLPYHQVMTMEQLARQDWNLAVAKREPPDPDWISSETGQELTQRGLIYPLKSCTTLRAGHYVPESDLSSSPTGTGSLGYLRIQDLSNGMTKVPTLWVPPPRARKVGRNHHLLPGDVLLSRSGTVDKAAVFPEESPPAIAGGGLMVISVNRRQLDPHFLVAWLQAQAIRDWLKTHSKRTVQPNLTLPLLYSMKIPLPPLELQTQIVGQIRNAGSDVFDCLVDVLELRTNRNAPRP